MKGNSNLTSMKFLIRGSYCLALTLPIVAGNASSQIQDIENKLGNSFLQDGKKIEISNSKKKDKSKNRRKQDKMRTQ